MDHDYIMNTAKLAHRGGCKHFHIVSSVGANAKSSFLYTKVKVRTERFGASTALNSEISSPMAGVCGCVVGNNGDSLVEWTNILVQAEEFEC